MNSVVNLSYEFEQLQQAYQASPYPAKEDRLSLLIKLKAALLTEKGALVSALEQDYGFRSHFDSSICDLMPSIQHINYTLKRLPKWLNVKKRHAGLLLSPSKVSVCYQPLGVVGVIVPWNFPIYLSIAPIVTAIAAGNRVMVKLSEYTPQTNQVLRRVFAELSQHVCIIEGEGDVAAEFSQLPFNHLLFTGSTQVGKLVASAAAKNLTPVTLELGGKSPVIIAEDADLTSAVDAIMLGKSMNAGQICVAPDYVFVPKNKVDDFISLYSRRFLQAFPEKKGRREYSHIINQAQYNRLNNYLEDAQEKGAIITAIGDVEKIDGRSFLPRLLTNVTDDMQVMKEEIFGPILPIMGYDKIEEPLNYIQARPRPLALYVMSLDKQLVKDISQKTHSGGLAVNDTMMHVAADDAPFGGIGDSGVGSYHGIEGFQTFSHAKTILNTPNWLPRARLLLKHKKWMLKILSHKFMS
ncbi:MULTISPECIES: coniferyl aldehyde dehydrogenase [Aliivibrio]|uniref:Aldehyde dehydrogenase n=1 Tax=Aliivibrio finisterrensis TaxID=511998 RepID=A0A4Q5KU62_9GAMM|nr:MULTISPECIES: coniferyl aldehyde dehydrogenase [Aliivibrio]MDD9179063.1 coniferyl aldehyde dehydrogenase [Aliivibrio sp. A6]RYU51527.1 coniferyl aldehyde dehydrogenase [Aliivibrio finisterrensis]RYU52752.1 coniferyl aldehyde dehydrogenase [Aliivibrio finisterrensis]RYU58250.1 coniferyl aldehyde dehydrogenase [Aliivibrio finisterrensis]RYU64066.1 coniferyl aldehyde dehydrogenase [Aliivibrio finisterrensis]